MKAVAFFILLTLPVPPAFTQQLPLDEGDLQHLTDDLLGFQDEEADYQDLYENLVQVMSAPYDLNKVTEEELRLLHVLTDAQIENFIAYRESQGYILDVYELQVIEGFDLALISKLLRFVKVKDPAGQVSRSLSRRLFAGGNTYFLARYGRALDGRTAGDTALSGSPDRLYLRLRAAEAGDYSAGFTAEKDAGERLTFKGDHPVRGFDFFSWHVQLQQKGRLKNIVAGDFQAQFAQGLLLGGAFGLGKGGETVSTVRKSHVGFLPYTAVSESAYQRGVAVTLEPVTSLRVSAFCSRARRDAARGTGADSLTVTSFQASGLHRTVRELENRKKVVEQNYGLVVHFDKSKLDAGLIVNYTHFSIPVKRAATLYNQFAFNGSQNLNTGIFVNYRFRNMSFFTEAGRSLSGGTGLVTGVLMSPHPLLDLAIVYRNYGKDFHSFHANAFSENTAPQNERGVYWGWKYRWNRYYHLTGYADLFSFPWLAFRRYAPASGYEWLLRGTYSPTKQVSVFLQVREEVKARNLGEMSSLYRLGEGLRRNVTANCDYGIGGSIRLRSRMQFSSYSLNRKTTEGFALIQDVMFKWKALKLSARHALFDTDHSDNRQYVYEQDAWLAYALPAYSGVGVRNYALIEYKVHKQVTIWLRFARTRQIEAGKKGIPHDNMDGNTMNDVKFQARFKF